MKRIGSQLVVCTPERILRQSAVEINDSGVVTNVFSLTESPVEAASTLFYDGIISADIVSLKVNRTIDASILQEYNYIDLSSDHDRIVQSEKQLILDFGHLDIAQISLLLRKQAASLSHYSIFEIISACCYVPAKIIRLDHQLRVGLQSRLLLWQGCNLVDKKLTHQLHIRPLI